MPLAMEEREKRRPRNRLMPKWIQCGFEALLLQYPKLIIKKGEKYYTSSKLNSFQMNLIFLHLIDSVHVGFE